VQLTKARGTSAGRDRRRHDLEVAGQRVTAASCNGVADVVDLGADLEGAQAADRLHPRRRDVPAGTVCVGRGEHRGAHALGEKVQEAPVRLRQEGVEVDQPGQPLTQRPGGDGDDEAGVAVPDEKDIGEVLALHKFDQLVDTAGQVRVVDSRRWRRSNAPEGRRQDPVTARTQPCGHVRPVPPAGPRRPGTRWLLSRSR
jgi:hypothetical protein